MLERLAVLSNAGEPMETDSNAFSNIDKSIASVTGQVSTIIDYTLSKMAFLIFSFKIFQILIWQQN